MLRHMLGLKPWVWADEPRAPPNRNYAAVNPGDPLFIEMEADGLVECYQRPTADTRYDWWRTTDKGRAVAFASVEHRKRSAAQRRYDRWLSIADCLGMTFGEYLTSTDPDIVERRHG